MAEYSHQVDRAQSPPPPHGKGYEERAVIADVAEGAAVRGDGRVDVDLNSRLGRTLSRIIRPPSFVSDTEAPAPDYRRFNFPEQFPLKLNIVIQVVGSRGDVQPFVALGCELRKHGHRVRLATHGRFESFVHDSGLEFYSIGGDPGDLMSYMVKNPGLIPSMQSLRAGDISRKREMIVEMLEGCWDSCIEADPMTGDPFIADAIIANPPSFAHIHCAEALGIPLHLVFTMPWSATRSFPHPLANVLGGGKDSKLANYLSYILVEFMTWQGLGDVINNWRRRIGLEPVPETEGPLLASTLSIPFTYCWSPALVPKPKDWPAHIDVSGFFFRETPDYTPPKALRAFLNAGPPPIYIGFGSIVLDNAAEMSATILETVGACGLRAIISRGWSRLDGPEHSNIFWLEDCPHEWLFQHVSAVVHHGGAGTAACGLRNARPTVVVPFFGDQPFWGDMVAAAGAGPKPIHHRTLNSENLADALRLCLEEATQAAAARIAEQMQEEDGVRTAVVSFLNNLPIDRMQCEFLDDQPACWALKVNGKGRKLSRLAAEILVEDVGIDAKNLQVHRTNPIVIENHRWDPVTGLSSGLIGFSTEMVGNIANIGLRPAEEYRRGRKNRNLDTGSEIRPQSRGSRVSTDSSLQNTSDGRAPSAAPSADSDARVDGARVRQSNVALAGTMALASGKSIAKVVPAVYKGPLVDWPLAVTEGFHNMPRLWGEEVRGYGKVTDWKSGGVVAGKSFALGIGDGLKDLVTMPGKGAEKGGAWGAIKGVAKGTGSLLTKTVGGTVGLVAYPGQGMVKTLWSLTHGETGKRVQKARRAEGMWQAQGVDAEVVRAVRSAYDSANLKR